MRASKYTISEEQWKIIEKIVALMEQDMPLLDLPIESLDW